MYAVGVVFYHGFERRIIMRTIDLVVVILYMAGMLGIGVYSRSKIQSMDDYILGGRRFNVLPLTATIMTTMTGAGMTLGMVGSVAARGSGIMWDLTGVAIGLVCMAFIAEKLRETNKRTLSEVIAGNNGKAPQIAAATVAAFYTLVLTGQNMAAVGRLLNYAGAGFGITATQATVIAAIILTAYTALGGLYSVVWTDFIQFIIMMVAIVILGPILAVYHAGGIAPIAEHIASKGFSLYNPATGNALWPAITFMFIMLLGVPGDPTSPQRALAAKNSHIAKRAFIWAALSILIWGMALTLIGGAAATLLPNIVDEWGTAEASFPIFAIKYYPPILTGLAFAGMLAAVMSTADSMLLLCTTHIIYDIAGSLMPNKFTEERNTKIMPYMTVFLGGLALIAALQISSLLRTLYFVFSMVGAAFIMPMLAQLYWPKKCTSLGVTAGVLLGGISTILMYHFEIMGPGGDPVYTGMFISALCIWLGSFTKSPKQQKMAA